MPAHRIVVLVLDRVLPIDFAIPVHVFGREAAGYYDVRTATVDGGPAAFAGGAQVIPDGGLELLTTADTLLVPGYDGAAERELDDAVLVALREAAERRARIASICSGAFALARAGLLDGLTVTTHWAMGDDLASGFPRVTVDAGALVVDNDTVLTSGGVTAGIDLALHLLRKDVGASVANHVARRLVMAPRPAGSQGQFAEAPPAPPGEDAIAATQRWMLTALDRPLAIGELADHAHLSARQFHRRFQDQTGTTPLAWLHEQRIGRAKDLLETTDLPIDVVGRSAGLGTAANVRTRFRQATGVSPSAYRRAFRGSSALGVA